MGLSVVETGSVLGNGDYLVALWDVVCEAHAWLAGRRWEDGLSAQTHYCYHSAFFTAPLDAPAFAAGGRRPRAPSLEAEQSPSCSEAPLSSEPFPPYPVVLG